VTQSGFLKTPPPARGATGSTKLLAIIAAGILGPAVAFGILSCRPKPTIENGMKALVRAYSKKRMIEPRLSGGFHAGSYDANSKDQVGDKAALEEAQDMILAEAANRVDPGAQLARGRLLLATGDWDKALPLLRQAAGDMQSRADVRNDFGACLFQKERYDDALDEFNQALELDPEMREALFNRALCYQQLLLFDAATADYTRFLEADRDPGWIAEAKRRSNQVSQPITPEKTWKEIISDFDSSVDGGDSERTSAVIKANFEVTWSHVLIPSSEHYLRLAVSGDAAKSNEALSRMGRVGRLFRETMGDSSIGEEAEYLRSLATTEWAPELQLITDLDNSLDAARASPSAAAGEAFEAVHNLFAHRGNNVLALYSEYCNSTNLYAIGEFNSSVRLLERLLYVAQEHRWQYFQNFILNQLGIDYIRLGHDSLGINYCNRALAVPNSLVTSASACQYISVAYLHLGDFDSASKYLRKSTDLYLAGSPDYNRLASNYLATADIYRLRAKHSLALLCAQAAVQYSGLANDKKLQAESISFTATEEAKLGDFGQAEADVKKAVELVSLLDPKSKGYAEPLVHSRAADIAMMQGDHARALNSYSQAENMARAYEGDQVVRIDALRGEARTLAASSRENDARSNLLKAVSSIESYRSTIAEYKNRTHFLDAMQGTFDQLIALDIKQSPAKEREAFAMSEQSRARTLLDQMNYEVTGIHERDNEAARATTRQDVPKQNKPFSLGEVMASLPDSLALLEYAVTDSATYIFVITRSDIHVALSSATTDTLDRLVGDYLDQLKERVSAGDLTQKERFLYQLLIAPIENLVQGKDTLCIVPDKTLHFLPFAPLIDQAGRYLIEKYTITYSPSASILVHCLRDSITKSRQTADQALIVGDPAFDRTEFPALQPLPEAREEAKSVSFSYRDPSVLLGEQATKDTIRSALRLSGMAHFAVHCVVDERSPWQAALLLARPAQAARATGQIATSSADFSEAHGLLYLSEVYQLEMPHLRLVVLSACESGLGKYYRGEGVVSLVRPFIAAHVPCIVATLWAVQSGATAEFMGMFHRLKRRGLSAGEALRQAQVAMSKEEGINQSPYYWAPFIVEGSDVN
jgi:CHAT domain-containing protein